MQTSDSILKLPAAGDFAILVSSFDGMDDTWDAFFALTNIYWPDRRWPIFIITNNKVAQTDGVQSIAVGNDRGWTRNLRAALTLLNVDHILYLQEDYFINAKVDSLRLQQIFENHKSRQADCTKIFSDSIHSREEGNDSIILRVKRDSPFSVSLQAAFWRVERLLAVLIDDEDQWSFERRTSADSTITVFADAEAKLASYTWSLPYFATGIVRGKWVPAAVRMCRAHGIEVDLNRRPMHKLWPLRQFFARIRWAYRYRR